jgi:hypothetical protein
LEFFVLGVWRLIVKESQSATLLKVILLVHPLVLAFSGGEILPRNRCLPGKSVI